MGEEKVFFEKYSIHGVQNLKCWGHYNEGVDFTTFGHDVIDNHGNIDHSESDHGESEGEQFQILP